MWYLLPFNILVLLLSFWLMLVMIHLLHFKNTEIEALALAGVGGGRWEALKLLSSPVVSLLPLASEGSLKGTGMYSSSSSEILSSDSSLQVVWLFNYLSLPLTHKFQEAKDYVFIYLCVLWVEHWASVGAQSRCSINICWLNEEICVVFYNLIIELLSRVQLFATPWTTAHKASLSFIISRSLLKSMSIESVMLSNYLYAIVLDHIFFYHYH